MNNKKIKGSNVVSTKVSNDIREKLDKCALKMGFETPYKFFQFALGCIIRITDDATEMTADMKRLSKIFLNPEFWTSKPNFLNYSIRNKPTIDKAVIFISDSQHPNPTPALIHDDTINYNTETILKATLSAVSPNLKQDLESVKKMCNHDTLIETLNYLISTVYQTEDHIHNDIQELFADNKRLEYGQDALDMGEGRTYKRKHTKQMYNKEFYQ